VSEIVGADRAPPETADAVVVPRPREQTETVPRFDPLGQLDPEQGFAEREPADPAAAELAPTDPETAGVEPADTELGSRQTAGPESGEPEAGDQKAGDPETVERAGPTYLIEAGGVDLREPLEPAQRQEFDAYLAQLSADGRTRTVNGAGPAYEYQRAACGTTEYRLSSDTDLPRATWADGLNSDLGLAQDAKYVHGDGPSWYRPDSLPEALRGVAQRRTDEQLTKYREAIADPANPVRGLELITNDPPTAEQLAGRMAVLQVPGIVRTAK
jgi:hypothetical protein